ncbi:hypothetical protein E1091_08595 [Micromonospora fluostatini]|uniref:XRE family transcriptional regulator n=1 Tax=Micromonospora fluostatini TaxID=1629071 RepID=A0ABY2DHP5_9ACTN|nr:hypothetical protein E1091_08595 [Micromonospora fluostatini]
MPTVLTDVPAGDSAVPSTGGSPSPYLDELLRRLKLAYRQAGNPSYRTIIRTTAIAISTSTISRTFNAKTPPKWENLTELLLALGVAREEIETTWHRLWMSAVNEVNPLTKDDKAAGELLPAGRRPKDVVACPRCGSWVADMLLHRRWHGLASPDVPSADLPPATVAPRRRR